MNKEKKSREINPMPNHLNKEVKMATKNYYRLVVIGSIIMILLCAGTMLSCDKRSAVGINPGGEGSTGVGNILVTLSPNQIRLSSSEATDSTIVGIAVVDSHGVGVQGIRVTVTRTPAIGFITQPETTDVQGRTSALFVAEPGIYDSTRIAVSVGNIRKTALLIITGPSNYSLSLNYNPPVPKLIDHNADPYTITATLVDTTQRGVSGQPVTFMVTNQVGRIGFSDPDITIPRTNSNGIVEALFYNTQSDEVNLPTSAEIQVVTQAPTGGGLLAASVSIPLRRVQNILTLEAAPAEVVGDGSSYTTIRAFLLDSDGHGIVGDTVYFSDLDHLGSITAINITNANGIASSQYTPFGGLNGIDTCHIKAEFRPGSLVHQAIATTNVAITPVRSIGIIHASLQKTAVTANGADTSSIFITAQDSTGGLIADGTIIYLDNTGTGFLSAPQITTTDGQARAKITAPANIVGGLTVDSIFVSGHLSDSTTVADTVIVNYVPGLISHVEFVYPESTITLIAGSGDTCSVIAYAVDVNGNPVANGTQINFRNDLDSTSSLTPRASATMNGYAKTTYLIGAGVGDDNVIAYAPNPLIVNDTIRTLHPVVFRCLSSQATTLSLAASSSNIEVGGSSSQIFATLQDAYGNPLSEGYTVAFDITVAPGSTGIPGSRPSFNTQFPITHQEVPTNINGQAIVQLYSGTSSGSVAIRACTVPSEEDSLYVCNEKSLVTISSGPPRYINITFAHEGEAFPGTPERFVQVGAIVGDRYSNPVQYGTAVYFSLLPPDIGDIEGDSYTGGARQYHPDSVNGVAYSRIIYGCFSTFDSVRIIASSAGDSAEVVDTSGSFFLPIYGGQLSLTATPGNLWTDNDNCNCTGGPNNNCRDTSFITALLVDDGQCPIKGGIIAFSAGTAGFIIEPSIDTTDVNGRAFARFVIRGCEIPPTPDGTQAMIECTVRAVLQQKPEVMAELTIVCRRPL
jgi:hypothetical protein